MEHIITEGEEEAYQSKSQYRNAQSEFRKFIKRAEGWQKFEFIFVNIRHDSACSSCYNRYFFILNC